MLIDIRKNKEPRNQSYVERRNSMRRMLGAMSEGQLRDFAARHSISLTSDDRQGMVIEAMSQYASWAGEVS